MGTKESAERFVSIPEAVNLSGYSRGKILKWLAEADSKIRIDYGNRGQRLVWLADVLARDGQSPTDDDEDDDVPDKRVYLELVRALAVQTKHSENLLEPFRKMGETYTTENTALRGRIKELEDRLHQMIATYEAALSAEHERRLQEARAEREQKRLDEALQLVKDYAPAAVAGVAGHFGLANVQEAVLVQKVAALSSEHIAALVAMGILGPSELAVIERIKATRKTNGHSKTEEQHHRTAAGDAGSNAPKSSPPPQ